MEEKVIDIGKHVECDMCSKVFTDSDEMGGLLFQSKAAGPCCAAKVEHDAKVYQEQKFIRGRCPPGMSFRDWVFKLRGGDNAIRVYTGTMEEVLNAMERKGK